MSDEISNFQNLYTKNFLIMEWQQQEFIISTDKGRLDVPYIHHFLSRLSYWAEDIPYEVVQRSVENSLCFGVYHQQQQIGFAHVITDEATFAYLADVFIDDQYRGKGLSKWLMQVIKEHPSLQGLRWFLLATKDAHSLYSQFGFIPLSMPERWMQIHQPDVYKRKT
jgi:N-acetylglutamate synthase-like GNAT family acetyltransferase